MNPFVNYIVKAGLSLGVFTMVYWFFLRKENRFNASRFYLLGALIFSTLLPFLTIRFSFFDLFGAIRDLAINPRRGTILLETVTVYASGFPAKLGQAILSFNYSVLIYQLGAIAAFFFIATGMFQLGLMITKNRVFKLKRAKLVISSREISPYSFFNFIFIGKELTTQENWKSMVHHEVEHVKQGHSFDVLFIDFMMVFQWFNPFYWLIRRMVRENHEFLADTAVLSKGMITPGKYKALLLAQAIGGRPVITSNFFNVRTIQKRFKMITKNKKGKLSFLKYSIGVFVALAITLMFACENKTTENNSGIVKATLLPDNKEIIIDTNKFIDAKSNVINPDDEVTFIMVENPATFQGGDLNSFRSWVQSNLKYPMEAAEKGISGKVYVSFAINSKGDVVDIKVLRGVDPSLDNESVRVIKSSPKWAPAKQGGKNVKQQFVIPLSFVLQ
jgi:TonB family protein